MKKLTESEKLRITYDCKQATFLIEKQQASSLTAMEKRDLKHHLKGCDACVTYKIQSTLIRKLAKKVFGVQENKQPFGKAFKEELQKKIDDKLNG